MPKRETGLNYKNLTFCVWNVGGLKSISTNKFHDPLFRREIKNFDIVLLTETHLRYNTYICVEDFSYYPVCRQQRPNSRYYGGLGIRGKQLLELCIASRLRILNVRMLGDSAGKFTCLKPTGSSVVIYVIMSEELLVNTLSSKDSDFIQVLSDCHCKLSFSIEATYCENKNNIAENNFPFPGRYI